MLNPSLVVTESLKEDLHDSKSRAFHIKFGLLTTSHFSTGGGEEQEIYKKLFCINSLLLIVTMLEILLKKKIIQQMNESFSEHRSLVSYPMNVV